MSALDDQLALLESRTSRPSSSWSDLLSLPEPIRTETLKEWAEDDWVLDDDRWADVLDIVNVLVTIAGAVSAFAGAGAAVAALRASL